MQSHQVYNAAQRPISVTSITFSIFTKYYQPKKIPLMDDSERQSGFSHSQDGYIPGYGLPVKNKLVFLLMVCCTCRLSCNPRIFLACRQMNQIAADSDSSYGVRKNGSQGAMQVCDLHSDTLREVMQSIETLTLTVKSATQDIEVGLFLLWI